MADLSTDIATQAVEPAVDTADGHTTQGRPIGELIQADQYLASRTAIRKKRRGIVYSKMLPPGALSDQGGYDSGR